MSIAATEVGRTAADRAVGVETGLSEEEAARRLAEAGAPARLGTSRSYASIVRANVLTVFNLILAGVRRADADLRRSRATRCSSAIIVANSAIGITQEVRAKRALDRLSLLVAPQATVRRDGDDRKVAGRARSWSTISWCSQPGDQLIADGPSLSRRRSSAR